MPKPSESQETFHSGHAGCLLCGENNSSSLRLTFCASDGGGVQATFHPSVTLQGYEGILHGGVISALLDAAMTRCLFHHGVRALTADLRVRFLHPVPCDAAVHLEAWTVTNTTRLYRLRSELSVGKRLMAWAEAKFLKSAFLPDPYKRGKLCE